MFVMAIRPPVKIRSIIFALAGLLTSSSAIESPCIAGPRAALKFAERTASGWSPPRSVASGTDLLVNAADVPSVRALSDGTLAAHWMQANGPDPEAYNLRLAWSKDSGATWSRPTTPHHDGTKTQHGFASLFQVPGGGLGLVWLDGRATNPESAHATDNMSLRAAVYSKNGTELSEKAIDTRVCDCCPTSVATTSDGPVVAFRNRSDKEVRDIFVTRLVAGHWSTPAAVIQDNQRGLLFGMRTMGAGGNVDLFQTTTYSGGLATRKSPAFTVPNSRIVLTAELCHRLHQNLDKIAASEMLAVRNIQV